MGAQSIIPNREKTMSQPLFIRGYINSDILNESS